MPYSSSDGYRFLLFDDAFVRGLDRFLETRLEPFSAKDALAALGKKCTEENISDVEDYLFLSPIVFRGYFGKGSKARWLTRAGLFQGKEFAVKVSKMEIALGIFIPASRCIPFANLDSAPSEYRFYSGRKALPQTVIEANLDEVAPFYALAGEEFAPEAVAADNGENIADIVHSAACIESGYAFPLKVVDMREFYWRHQVKPGDCLVIKVISWRNSRFSVRIRRQDEDAESVEKWRKVFWQFLEKSFEDSGPCNRIEEQLAQAFFLGRNSKLFALPPDDIVNAIELSPDIRFFSYGMETRLWKGGVDFPVHEDWDAWLEDVFCAEEPDIFYMTKFPVLPEVLYAYIKDSLWRGEDSPLPLVERLCKANGGKTAKACLEAMETFAARGYRALSPAYNVFEDIAANLRAGLLDFYSRIVSLARFCQAAGAAPANLNTQHILVLTQLSAHIVDSLHAICYDVRGAEAEEMPPAESLSGMNELLSEIEVSLRSEAENYRNRRRTRQH